MWPVNSAFIVSAILPAAEFAMKHHLRDTDASISHTSLTIFYQSPQCRLPTSWNLRHLEGICALGHLEVLCACNFTVTLLKGKNPVIYYYVLFLIIGSLYL